jgi:hypothetical protein
MKKSIALSAIALSLAMAVGGAVAQTAKPTGTETGTDTSKSTAGTGNAGDSTMQVGSKTKATHRMSKKAKRAAMAASAQ